MKKTITIFGSECPVLHEFYNSYSLVEFQGMPAVWYEDDARISVIHSAELPDQIRRDAAEMVAKIWEQRTKALRECVTAMEAIHEKELPECRRNAVTNALIGARNALPNK